MKRVAVIIGICLALAGTAGAQILHEPNDPIYKALDRWYARGYIGVLLPVRPYPAQVIEDLLTQVQEKGDPAAAAEAAEYRKALEVRRPRVTLRAQVSGEDDDLTPLAMFGVDGLFRPESWMSIGASLDVWGTRREVGKEITVPGIYSPYPDMVNDNSSIGSTQILQNWNSVLSLGSADLYFQAGMNRGSFGPFFDNGVVLGPQAGHAGHFSAAYVGKNWRVNILHLALAGTDQYGLDRYPDKHMVVHSFDFDILPGLELGFFESVVYGDRLDLMYMAPFNFMFHSQGVTGFSDNSYLGLKGSWRPTAGLQFKGLVYVDDAGFNDIAKLNLDTKYKLAGQAGGVWAPLKSWLRTLSADYTAVMPYMYTHNWNLDEEYFNTRAGDKAPLSAPAYSNYLHLGNPMGTELLPNSDRISVRSAWTPVRGLNLSLAAEFIRHGNATANSDADYDARYGQFMNGDYLDDGRDEDGKATFQGTTRFLTQKLIEKTLRVAPGFEFGVPSSLGVFSASADVVFQWGWNRGLVKNDDGFTTLFNCGVKWRY